MILDQQKIVGLVNAIVDARCVCKQAIAASEQVIEIPAVAATDKNPGKPAGKKATGQLGNASNNLFIAASNLIGHLRNIAPEAASDIAALEKKLNAPVAAPQASVPAAPANGATPNATVK